MKKIAILLLFINYVAIGQDLSWKKMDIKDSVSISQNIKLLTNKVILQYEDDDKANRLDNLFRLRIATGEYELANSLIDSVRNMYQDKYPDYANVMGIHYKVVNNSWLKNKKEQVPFKVVFEQSFKEATKNLSRAEMTNLEYLFIYDPKELEDKLNKKLEAQNAKDSISIDDAILLIRTFVAYKTYSAIGALAKPLVSALDNQFYIIRDSVSIPVRRGGNISAIVVREKNAPAKAPTVLMFSIYPSDYGVTSAKEISSAGYVGIIAYTRGKRHSDNEIDPFEFDAQDAYDVIDWISKQPWSNGKVGMYGGSYLGFAQWAATKKVHPALKTIVPQVAVGIGIDYPKNNGVFMSYMLRWIRYVTNNKLTDNEDFRKGDKWDSLYNKWYRSGKSFRALDSLVGKSNPIFQRWLDHPDFDNYWQDMTASGKDFSKIDIPVLTMTGYYDDDQLGALYYFKEHHKFHKNPNHYLLIGPYDHYGAQGYPEEKLKGYTLDSVANIDINKLTFEWFDHILKDSVKPVFLKNKINIQVMGKNKWRHASKLDEVSNDTLKFYLDNTFKDGYYQLARTVENKDEYIRNMMDFADRNDTTHIFSVDYRVVDSTLNTGKHLVFSSLPFEKPFELNGQFGGKLHVLLNKRDMDVNIGVYEVLSDGRYFNLSNYIGRASYAIDRTKRNLLRPNEKEWIPIKNSFFTSRLIAKGSRLLVLLSVNKNPKWQINYGSGKDVSNETIRDAKEPLEIKWFTDSYLEFPIFKE